MQIAQIFFDTHMGKNFVGLNEIARKAKVNTKENLIVFMNTKKTKFKLLIDDKYLVYHDNKDQMIDLNYLRHLPRAFEGTKFDFSKSVEAAITEKFLPSGDKK